MPAVAIQTQGSIRVGLNAHLLSLTRSYRGAGINGYIHNLLANLPTAEARIADRVSLRYVAYLHDPAFVPPAGLEVRRSGWDTRQPWRRIVWEQTRLALESHRLGLLHGLAFAVPLVAGCPTVVTVHDLSFLRFPKAFRPANRWYLSFVTRASTRRAARVIAVSESTRRDVVAFCGVPAERVVVVPNGVTEAFQPGEPAAVAEFRQRRGLPDRFVLFVGTLEPRKNLVRLIEAFARWRRVSGEPVSLIIAGAKGWYYDEIFARAAELGMSDQVVFPGFIPDAELPGWYQAAEAFVYPSLFEGFGLPVLEAMACGTPVITSTVSSLPEVAGDAALLVDPEDTDALADAIAQVVGQPTLAARLRESGLRQARRFSWSRSAAETIQVYRGVLGLRPAGPASDNGMAGL